jgi:hypothetical protein
VFQVKVSVVVLPTLSESRVWGVPIKVPFAVAFTTTDVSVTVPLFRTATSIGTSTPCVTLALADTLTTITSWLAVNVRIMVSLLGRLFESPLKLAVMLTEPELMSI